MASEDGAAGGAGGAAAAAGGAGGVGGVAEGGSSVQLPIWRMPSPMASPLGFFETAYPLKVYNSLTRTKVPFIPMKGKRVLWYMCGPTVYDSAHLGHARTYLSFDIIRRVMVDFFGFDVVLAMNITDIDDKIIMRSNERGISFAELSRFYETEFLEDMAALGILPVDVMTRISEFVPETLAYIQRIMDNGFAYASNGSVYFDTVAYQESKHDYGKLVPENVGDAGAVDEGEGKLEVESRGRSDKRNPCDFALWKKSREGEPWWESPWGNGRPGWHIECSAMSTAVFNDMADGHVDIHSGGWDLRFPHHDNEIAQAEAHFDFQQWINYWVHSGHLHIEGKKMSKSEKNFFTIREVLDDYSARQLRFFFLRHKYNAPMDYSKAGLAQAVALEKRFSDFFDNVKAKIRTNAVAGAAKWHAADGDHSEHVLANAIVDTRAAVREALADDFDTPAALLHLQRLVTATNKYIAAKEEKDETPVPYLLIQAGDTVTRIFRVFGLVFDYPIGFGDEGGAGAGREETLAPVLDAVTSFRDKVRAAARAGDTAALLAACDEVRDVSLRAAGVQLEDGKEGKPSTWKLRSAEELESEKKEEEAKRDAAAARKAEQRKIMEARKAAADAAGAVNPADMFKDEKDDEGKPAYSKFDADGVPTHDGAGEELPKNRVKKLKKAWAVQKKKFDKANA
uniref:cysteine--tRNA ligase n=1 Tax=Bicosoecida sp. CB-2014 TaxID=1486930 RepID=A0A7S1CFU2_9STRA